MRLAIGERIVDAPIDRILTALREATGKPAEFRRRGDDFLVTCPFHKDGREAHPSCHVYCGSGDVEYGYMHCFTCGENGPLWHFVGQCLGAGDEAGREWLVGRFSNAFEEKSYDLPPLEEAPRPKYLPESALVGLQPWHPYMARRGLSREVCSLFQVGYDPKDDSLVFPVRDERGRLVMMTRRSVSGKRFMIDADAEKPVYLLDYAIKSGFSELTVVESQINALTLYSWGYPAVALFGTGTKAQYEILRRSGIRTFYLAFDGDDAGEKGTRRFLRGMPQSALANVIGIPRGKDVNDLTREEFEALPIWECHDWAAAHGGWPS